MAQGTRCTVERSSGRFCDRPAAPGIPFPICVRHATILFTYMQAQMAVAADDPYVWMQVVAQETNAAQERQAIARYKEKLRQRDLVTATLSQLGIRQIVYYLRVGALIKIGTTGDWALRRRGYPPDAIKLAQERGGELLEAERLIEFRSARAHGREWFYPSADLVAHINTLRPEPLTAVELTRF